ncbi:hypothetical protein Cantr_06213 [Candida viswanathii]|uniref:Uncharacterized protein n=1 Tax=Candida viswanathii TaxID=5486 RepID=A0A367XWC0_9ASCO|nr:hypothetical protein Cantr_06213 [Candida viswanathii]
MSPFTIDILNTDILDLPLDTYPNPLIEVTVSQLERLTTEEYQHLTSIKYGKLDEMDQFCECVVEIIKKNLIHDPKRAKEFYMGIKDSKLQQRISSAISKHYMHDALELSIWEWIAMRDSMNARVKVRANIEVLLQLNSMDRSSAMLTYLRKLVDVGSVNPHPVLLHPLVFEKLLNAVRLTDHVLLYLYMFHLNIQCMDIEKMLDFKKTLMKKSHLGRYVVLTGYIPPVSFGTMNTFSIPEDQKQKMVYFMNVCDFEYFIENAANHEHGAYQAVFYWNCMLEKFEKRCAIDTDRKVEDDDIRKDVESLLKSLLSIVMAFKGCAYCVDILRYMGEQKLKPLFLIYHMLMSKFRKAGHFNEFIVVLNNIKMDELDSEELNILGKEVLSFIEARFPTSPKVMIGYIGAMYGNQGLELLNRLKILGLPYAKSVSAIPSVDVVQIANLDDKLKGLTLDNEVLAYVYRVLLKSDPSFSRSSEIILKLYREYILFTNDPSRKLVGEYESDDVISVFLNALLLTDEEPKRGLIQFSQSRENYNVAKAIATTYYTTIRRRANIRNMELLVQVALLHHNDLEFALHAVQISRARGRPVTFLQIYPFIKYYVASKDYEQAKVWYDLMLQEGATSIRRPIYDVLKLARTMGWGNVPRLYKLRQNVTSKIIKYTEDQLARNPLQFNLEWRDDDEGFEDIVTDEDAEDFVADEVAEDIFADEVSEDIIADQVSEDIIADEDIKETRELKDFAAALTSILSTF